MRPVHNRIRTVHDMFPVGSLVKIIGGSNSEYVVIEFNRCRSPAHCSSCGTEGWHPILNNGYGGACPGKLVDGKMKWNLIAR